MVFMQIHVNKELVNAVVDDFQLPQSHNEVTIERNMLVEQNVGGTKENTVDEDWFVPYYENDNVVGLEAYNEDINVVGLDAYNEEGNVLGLDAYNNEGSEAGLEDNEIEYEEDDFDFKDPDFRKADQEESVDSKSFDSFVYDDLDMDAAPKVQ